MTFKLFDHVRDKMGQCWRRFKGLATVGYSIGFFRGNSFRQRHRIQLISPIVLFFIRRKVIDINSRNVPSGTFMARKLTCRNQLTCQNRDAAFFEVAESNRPMFQTSWSLSADSPVLRMTSEFCSSVLGTPSHFKSFFLLKPSCRMIIYRRVLFVQPPRV